MLCLRSKNIRRPKVEKRLAAMKEDAQIEKNLDRSLRIKAFNWNKTKELK
jgi:hypothetical protein